MRRQVGLDELFAVSTLDSQHLRFVQLLTLSMRVKTTLSSRNQWLVQGSTVCYRVSARAICLRMSAIALCTQSSPSMIASAAR